MSEYLTKRIMYPKPYTSYAAAECTVSGNAIDWDVKSNTDLFDHINVGNDLLVSATGSGISLKFNNPTNDAWSMATDDVFSTSNFSITNIYVTTAAEFGRNIKVFLTRVEIMRC